MVNKILANFFIRRLATYYKLSIDDFLGLTAEESEAINQKLLENAEKLPPGARKTFNSM